MANSPIAFLGAFWNSRFSDKLKNSLPFILPPRLPLSPRLMTIEQLSKSLSEINIHELIQTPNSPLHSPHLLTNNYDVEVHPEFYDIVRRPRRLIRSPSSYDLNDPGEEYLMGLEDVFQIDVAPLDVTKEPLRDGSDVRTIEVKEQRPVRWIVTRRIQ